MNAPVLRPLRSGVAHVSPTRLTVFSRSVAGLLVALSYAPPVWAAEKAPADLVAPPAQVAPHGTIPSGGATAPTNGTAPTNSTALTNSTAPNAAPPNATAITGTNATGAPPPAASGTEGSADAPPSPAVQRPADPHGAPNDAPLLSGSPFASPAHRHQAELLRAGRSPVPQTQSAPSDGIPPGTIGLLIRDAERRPVDAARVKLFITHESIAEGNKESVQEKTSDVEGRVGFVGLSTDSSYKYEAVVERDGARYSTGPLRLRRESGMVAVLYVFPTTQDIAETFVITRMLYALQPREDIFQVDTILRIQNGGTKTWRPQDFWVELPKEASAFRPPRAEGDIRAIAEGNRVHVTGSFTPGQHELSFGFQVPNPRTPNIELTLQTVPHLTDTRVFLEATDTMGLQVDGLRPAEKTRGQEGQNALMASQDFLGSGSTPPATLAVTITGMPPRGSGNLWATLVAGLIAAFGVVYTLARPNKEKMRLTDDDKGRAKALLVEELVNLEKAFRAKEIGPKTYEQARKTLLDSIARIES